MSEPRRRWFQIHLSTAVVVMVVTATIIGANTVESSIFVNSLHGRPESVQGWPFPIIFRFEEITLTSPVRSPFVGRIEKQAELSMAGLVMNFVVSILLLGIVAGLFEHFIHRREIRQP